MTSHQFRQQANLAELGKKCAPAHDKIAGNRRMLAGRAKRTKVAALHEFADVMQ